MTTLSLTDLLDALNESVLQVNGKKNRLVNRPSPIREAVSNLEIAFCKKTGQEGAELVKHTKAGIILCPDDPAILSLDIGDKTLIVVKNPRLSFLRLVERFFVEPPPRGIHPTAFIEPEASVDPDVYIGPFTYVGNCEIGKGTVIFGHVHIYSNVRIGRDVTIHAGTVIGADGFGYQRNEQGALEKFPQIGGVVIEDNVEIGANTCIDRGALGNTIIHSNTKIDNLVHIAHNVSIGHDSVVIANAMIAGSVKIGDYSWVAPSATTRESIVIGDRAMVGLAALVVKDVPDDTVVMGAPARPADEYKKLLDTMKRSAGL